VGSSLHKVAAEQAIDQTAVDVDHDPEIRTLTVSLLVVIPHPGVDSLPDRNHLAEPCCGKQLLVKGSIVVEHFLDVFDPRRPVPSCAK
jgi:hypothetical protein